jgi:pimeloyl-ACP methyl ester carboxylesterase
MARASALLLAAALVAAGCGGGEDFPERASVRTIGKGADMAWIFRPAGEPRSVVLYFHGQGGPVEATPTNHRPWIDHLVERGNVVIYPRYELRVARNPMIHVVNGVRSASEELGLDDEPVLAIGYSRGGALALEYAAVAPIEGLPAPDAIMSVFPASRGEVDTEIDFTPLDDETSVLFLLGEDDTVVRGDGARILLRRLREGAFPPERIDLRFVRSRGDFVADHFAPLRTTPAARAAFWGPADRLIDSIT